MLIWSMVAAAADLNCNGLPSTVEVSVNLADPLCASHINPMTGAPYQSADAYYDYNSFGCLVLVADSLDEDQDGLSSGEIYLNGIAVTLSCDTCPSIYDPLNLDSDYDEIGDSCELTLELSEEVAAGEEAQFIVGGAASGANITLLTSKTLGTRRFGVCPELFGGVAAPKSLSSTTADGYGAAALLESIPSQAAGQTRYYQAIDLDSCLASNVLAIDL